MSETRTRVKVRRRSARPEFRPDIQGLRAVAVLLVVASHAGITAVEGGFVGVDVFFVISGFLITGLLIKEGQRGRGISLSNFYARRARRILPAATLVLAATLLLSVLFLGYIRAGEVGAEAVWAAFFAINWKFSRDGTDYFASNLPPSPLQHYWSLAVEEQFYLVWPLLFSVVLVGFAMRARRRRRALRKMQGISRRQVKRPTRRQLLTPNRQLFLAGVIALLAVGSFAYSVSYTASTPNAAYFSALTRVWELAVGSLLALLLPQLAKVPRALQAALSWIGLAGIAATAVLLTDTVPFPGSVAAWPVLATALVIAGGVGKPAGGAVVLLGQRPMRWIGDRSYSLYLWHWPVLVIGAAYQGRDLTVLESGVLVLVALLLTMATYTYVEYPIHKGKLRATRQSSLALWPVSVTFVALLGLVAVDAARAVPVFTGPGFEFAAAPAPVQTGAVPLPTRSGPPRPGPQPVDPAPTTESGPPPEVGSIEEAVLAAVNAARGRAPVPDPLSPALGSVREDTWENAAPCAAEGAEVQTEVCTYGPQDSERKIAIVGDSHAGMWVQALATAAERYGWTLYYFVKGGCSSADIVPVGSGRDQRQTGCQAWRDWAVGQIVDLAPDVAVLANRGDKAMIGPEGNEVPNGSAEHERIWGDAVASTVEDLAGAVDRVYVFGETPIVRDPVSCLSAPGADLGSCLSPLSATVVQTNDADERGASDSGGQYVDVNRWLCADALCPSVIEGIVVYTDGQHLTLTFAAALAETVAVELGMR